VLGTAIGAQRAQGGELTVSPRVDLSRDTHPPHLLGGSR
jgi:hypothetical protein